MSNLIAVAYPDAETAEGVRAELVEATKEHLITLEDAVVVVHQADGKVKLHQAVSPAAAGAAGGAVWGGLIGLLFLAPVVGMAIGAASGALGGKMADVGVNDDFMKTLGREADAGERRAHRPQPEQRAPRRSSSASPSTAARSSRPR